MWLFKSIYSTLSRVFIKIKEREQGDATEATINGLIWQTAGDGQ